MIPGIHITRHAYKVWKERVNSKHSYFNIVSVLRGSLDVSYEIEGEYVLDYNNRSITAVVRDKRIITFLVKGKLKITAHACSRWRDRVDKNATNKEIEKIFERLNCNEFDPNIEGKYIINYNDKNIIAVIKDNILITLIVNDDYLERKKSLWDKNNENNNICK